MANKKVSLSINGVNLQVPEDYTVLLAAREAGIDIPTLCYLKDINEVAACRLCVCEVEINGRPMRNLPTACVLKVEEGMVVKTDTARVRKAVKMNLELILANHNRECLTCTRNQTCELQTLCYEMGIDMERFDGEKREVCIDDLSPSIIRDSSKCVLCGRCVSACSKIQGINVLEFVNRGVNTKVAPGFGYSMKDTDCIYCGQCINACPVAAIKEKEHIKQVWEAISDPEKIVVVQTAPAVRAALGEEFGVKMGKAVTGKMVSALKRLGFDRVFDTNFSADLTIIEEGHEFINRLKNGGALPLITSCSPGWIRYCEVFWPEFIENLSTCKSPQQMFGAVVKSFYAKKENLDPKNIVSVSVMPCTAKKAECARPEMQVDGYRDVDYVLTTRELAKMINEARILFDKLPESDPDPVLGEYTGAGVIFGATGGVMEAALRSVADILTGKDLKDIEYSEVRGIADFKQASAILPIGDKKVEVNVGVVSSISAAEAVLKKIKNGELQIHFLEVMACPGGCVHGGGQPHVSAKDRIDTVVKEERAKALYSEDKRLPQRKSHKNAEVQALYDEYLKVPNGPIAHKLLHTHYAEQFIYMPDVDERV
ncbi:MAG: NADH-dependent [FeFe] hydrogenase, group A6 [Eubacteriales bacterium]|nr:NADH-dependent [FeFe] hydrogenase, group A6 [Eubacteriales bacterium]